MISVPVVYSSLLTQPQQRLFAFTAFLLGASLPTSNPLMNIALGLALVCLLWRRDTRQIGALASHPLVWLPALMFALLALSLLTHTHDYGPKMVGKYQKLLYVLPLALFFLADRRLLTHFVSGFVWANALILAISLAGGLGHVTLGGLNPDNPTVFKLQITQNVFMAFAALIWLSRTFEYRGLLRWGYAGLVLLATVNVLLMVQGRTGYVALAAGMGTWLLLTLRRKQLITVLACGTLAIAMLVMTPNRAMERLTLGVQQIQGCVLASAESAYRACDNSMGQRTAFAREAIHLIKRAPLLGNGAGSFWYGNADTDYGVHNPHNEYLLQTVQTGLLGLMVFLTWMWGCYRAGWQLPTHCRTLFVAVLSSYMACHLFNSFLLDSSEGHLFVIIAALLAGFTIGTPQSENRYGLHHPSKGHG
ncbi:O-antigen ligase family protein [Serratia proteamaculans]|jgi:O-antigen ligase|uniref:O-antigen ligase family protein n=1 Tax=Serratia proteamaculans TaxID=28151 RepID=UPI000D88B240|nr:O-antigen ligase family protein [Serratia proteamaculans]CAI1094617.1 Lipid A core - O-antigen ligase and related enzymes [Serratia proteamaculans]CAI1129649.1 Lipid A core - O-antigen ligase and related enzymes [Serratia proteamaculans]SPZ57073.1 Lipid A core - O-antigen ligase and related enzymes [Serratia quinivorans]